jgi:hypothetical protein
MYHVDQLLGNDREISKYTRAVAELTPSQKKHVPKETTELQ